MRSPKSREKKESPETNDSQLRLNIALSILPKEKSRKLLDHFSDELKLREQLCQFLENSDLCLTRPILAPRLTMLLADGNQNIQPMGTQHKMLDYRFDDASADLIGKLNPESDLWDAALVDYLMECIFWAGSDWFKEIERLATANGTANDGNFSIFNTPLASNSTYHPSMEKSMAISVITATVYALIRHLQLWQLAKQNTSSDSKCPLHESTDELTGLVAEIRFLKSLFQYPPKLTESSLMAEYCPGHKNLYEFQNRFAGFLSILDETAATILIQFLNENFLHMFRLIEAVFGPTTAHAQNVIEIPCPLHFDTILQTFDNQNARWPPPLSEAMPLKFIDKYQDLFDSKVTRWINLAKEDQSTESTDTIEPDEQPQSETGPEKQSLETKIQTPEPTVDWSEKYLTILDNMAEPELEAIAKLSPNETDEVIKKLIGQILVTNHQLSDQMAVQIKTEQTNLAQKLVEKSKSNLAQFSKSG